MRSLSLHPAGDRGVLCELGQPELEELHAVADWLRPLAEPGVLIVGHSSILALFDGASELQTFISALRQHRPAATRTVPPTHELHTIPVSFTGKDALDLPLLLERAAMTRAEFLDRITGLRLRARFLGFRPGFAYLEGWPSEWSLPRRATSRDEIPAGSFAIAGEMAGFYPAASAGGWNILGRAPQAFWDPARERPNLIAPGDAITIVPAERLPPVTPGSDAELFLPAAAEPVARVLEGGQRTLLVGKSDIRRCAVGLPAGGAFDPPAAEAANRAVGNAVGETLLECTMVGPRLRILRPLILSWYGASASIHVNAREVAHERQFAVEEGDVVEIGGLAGVRGYLAAGGGICDPSPYRSLSPTLVQRGMILHGVPREMGARARITFPDRTSSRRITVVAGPHPVDASLLNDLIEPSWTVTTQIDRTGLRLRAPSPRAAEFRDVLSCGMQFGTVQLHPNGDLMVMGPDHPVTGGYPQPFTVCSADLWKLGQLQPGERVQFVLVQDPAERNVGRSRE